MNQLGNIVKLFNKIAENRNKFSLVTFFSLFYSHIFYYFVSFLTTFTTNLHIDLHFLLLLQSFSHKYFKSDWHIFNLSF